MVNKTGCGNRSIYLSRWEKKKQYRKILVQNNRFTAPQQVRTGAVNSNKPCTPSLTFCNQITKRENIQGMYTPRVHPKKSRRHTPTIIEKHEQQWREKKHHF